MPKKNPPQIVKHYAVRAGEGVSIEVTKHNFANPDGSTGLALQLDLSNAPVPSRRYVSDTADVVEDAGAIKLLLGQMALGGALRALLVIQMTPESVSNFVDSVDAMVEPTLTEIVATTNAPLATLKPISSEPEQTVAVVANLVACAVSGREACIDFFHASSFAFLGLKTQQKLPIDAIVRVDMRLGLLIALVDKLRDMRQQFQLPWLRTQGELK